MILKLISGGSWLSGPRGCRSATRCHGKPSDAYRLNGFRVVCNEPERSIPKGKLISGGSWVNNPRNCRSATRNHSEPGYTFDVIGFRVVCNEPELPQPNHD